MGRAAGVCTPAGGQTCEDSGGEARHTGVAVRMWSLRWRCPVPARGRDGRDEGRAAPEQRTLLTRGGLRRPSNSGRSTSPPAPRGRGKAVQGIEARVVRPYALVDREQGVRERCGARGRHDRPLITLSELVQPATEPSPAPGEGHLRCRCSPLVCFSSQIDRHGRAAVHFEPGRGGAGPSL